MDRPCYCMGRTVLGPFFKSFHNWVFSHIKGRLKSTQPAYFLLFKLVLTKENTALAA
jgi:hypothetical protein